MTRAKSESILKPKQIAVSVAACFALHAAQLQANPTGPSVAFGGVGFSGLGTGSLTITNQAGGNAIINWNGFSIGANELTKFQQFANLAVLNRVTGNELSSILGALQSDGRVFLINPNGIVFGANARIDTAGLVASSLGLSDQDFLSNRLRFTEVPGAGAVVNNGVIQTAAGGRVYMVAPTVENNGLIQSPQGAIVLAAGREVELVDANTPFVTVKLAASTDSAVNVGNLIADSGRIGMFGTLVRNGGNIAASSAVAGPGGEIRLVASKDLTLDAGSTVTANGASGGKVQLQAEGGTNLIGGTVEAKGSAGKGGEVQALGVRVGVVGHGVIDASGDAGGGTVLVGGDYQGKNAAVRNAERTYVGSDGVIRADAMTTGDGGRVVVWADGNTGFFGSVSARGGSQSGNGGFVETSGKEALQAFGQVNTTAANGVGGTWLLDPGNINIVGSNSGPDDALLLASYGALIFSDGPAAPATSTIGVNTIDGALASNGSVLLQAVQDINLQANVNPTNPGNLTLQAGDNIHMGANSISMQGNLTLAANDSLAQSAYGAVPTTGAITSSAGGGNITTGGGSLSASGMAVSLGNINTVGGAYGGGQVNVFATVGDVSTGAITSGGGFVGLDANNGAVMVGGAINTSNPLTTGFGTSNGNVSIFAYGNITTQSITTRSLHPSNGVGGSVTLNTNTGVITVNGDIDTRGANGFDDGNFSSQYYGGTSAGDVALGRSAQDGFTGNAVTVNGNILASGGNGLDAPSSSAADQSGGNGGFVSMGGNCDGPCIYGPANGNFLVTGVISTMGGKGGNTLGSSDASSHGGYGGEVYADTVGSMLFGAIDARGGSAGDTANGSNGNYGGNGGLVQMNASGGFTAGWIDASGGAGGAGGETFSSYANGGNGGYGGQILVNGGSVVIGTAVSLGGNGGAGGSAQGLSYGAIGGTGGNGGFVSLNSTSGPVSTIAIATSGGAGGNGGFAYGGDASGGFGGNGGSVNLQGNAGVGVAASIVTRGGNGGSGGSASGNLDASGGGGGDAGQINANSAYGSVNIGWVDGSGGAGGAGGLADNVAFGDTFAIGGDGGEAGYMNFSAATTIDIGSITARGGAGGAGGVASGGDPLAQKFTEAPGGNGGSGYSVYASGQGAVTIGPIDASGGQGGSGGVSMDAFGGDGGNSAYSVSLYSATKVTAGPIFAQGGSGGAGGVAQTDAGDSSGGWAGWGGSVYLQTSSATGAITTGKIDASGGNGGNSGGIGTTTSTGGAGGSGGYVYYFGSTIDVKGPIFARGGNGGDMINSSILSSGGGTPDGGSAGSGGSVTILATGEVKVNVGGTLGAVAIDVSGGMGGSGHPAASPAGNGGAGGSAGSVNVVGTPNMTFFGSVNAAGGNGGAGGAGNATNIGGNGGAGGSAGPVYLDASSVTGTATGDGIIFVLAGSKPFFGDVILGGAGGAAGVDGGAGAGTVGAAGGNSTFISMSDYFGTIVVLDPLSILEVNTNFQQTVNGADDSTTFVGGEDDKKKDEDKSKKEFGSCKG
jgi:filamentous hemagglutinin family protein